MWASILGIFPFLAKLIDVVASLVKMFKASRIEKEIKEKERAKDDYDKAKETGRWE